MLSRVIVQFESVLFNHLRVLSKWKIWNWPVEWGWRPLRGWGRWWRRCPRWCHCPGGCGGHSSPARSWPVSGTPGTLALGHEAADCHGQIKKIKTLCICTPTSWSCRLTNICVQCVTLIIQNNACTQCEVHADTLLSSNCKTIGTTIHLQKLFRETKLETQGTQQL